MRWAATDPLEGPLGCLETLSWVTTPEHTLNRDSESLVPSAACDVLISVALLLSVRLAINALLVFSDDIEHH